MAAPAYALTNYFGTSDPAGDIVTLIETQLTSAGWTFVEAYAFTASATNYSMRVWKNPSTLNASGADFYIGLVKLAVAGTYLSVRAFESWNTSTKVINRPVLSGATTLSGGWLTCQYLNSQFVAINNTTTPTAATSPDGITWTSRSLPTTGSSWNGIAYGNGVYVTLNSASTIAASSPDAITWTARTLPSSLTWKAVTYGAGLFVALASGSATYATSPDGITWTSRTMPSSLTYSNIMFANGLFVALASSTATAYTSPDGITWTARTLPSSQVWTGLTYGNSTWLAVASGTVLATSPDGITWTSRTVTTGQYNGASYGNGVFVVVSNSSGASIITSPDGITWTSRTGALNYGYASAYGNSTFVIVPSSSQTVPSSETSPDGITWTNRAGPSLSSDAAVGDFVAANTSTQVFCDNAITLSAFQSYDVGILASKSYLVVGINNNGTGINLTSFYVGLYSPAYSDAQITTPPLCNISMTNNGYSGTLSGVSRATRVPGAFSFGASIGPESVVLGSWSGATKDYVTQGIRGSRVAVIAGAFSSGNQTNGGLRGYLYDAFTIQVTPTVLKIADTATIGATTWTALGQSLNGNVFNVSSQYLGMFFNTGAGS